MDFTWLQTRSVNTNSESLEWMRSLNLTTQFGTHFTNKKDLTQFSLLKVCNLFGKHILRNEINNLLRTVFFKNTVSSIYLSF